MMKIPFFSAAGRPKTARCCFCMSGLKTLKIKTCPGNRSAEKTDREKPPFFSFFRRKRPDSKKDKVPEYFIVYYTTIFSKKQDGNGKFSVQMTKNPRGKIEKKQKHARKFAAARPAKPSGTAEKRMKIL